MRQVISGVIAAATVMIAGAAPAMACGYTACSPCATYATPCGQAYAPAYGYAPTVTYGPTGYEHLADPDRQYYTGRPAQYYYVNQGPTYTGPGRFAPNPVYQEGTAYSRPYHWHHRYTFYPHRHGMHY